MFHTSLYVLRRCCAFRGGFGGVRNHLWLGSLKRKARTAANHTRKIGTSIQDFPGSTNMAKIISIEGNIGVGKTTLAYKLGGLLNYSVFVEPTAKNPYLARFYADPKTYAMKLQLWIFKQRYLIYTEALNHFSTTGQGVIMDRSVFSDEVFAHVSHDLGNISDDGFSLYNKLRKRALKSLMPPHLFVYLDASPQICLDRIKTRGRQYERGITTDYLTMLTDNYHNLRNSNKSAGIPELYYDWSTIGCAELVAKDVKLLGLKWLNGTVLEKYKNFRHKNMPSPFITELESELSETEEDNIDMQIAERDAFRQENES